MKRNYVKPYVAVMTIETTAIMAGSGGVNNNAIGVKSFDSDQQYKMDVLAPGGDADDDVSPASKNHVWDNEWD